jgi:hypothetical protein
MSNSKLVDVLDEDKPIANQKYVCVSFISPENILKDKHLFFFNKFLKNWDFTKSIEKYNKFIHFISYKYNLEFDTVIDDFKEFVENEKEELTDNTLLDDYKNFKDNNEEKLEEEFNKSIDFNTSVRGIKIRGTFPSMEEAELRCKILREVDPNHDVYVGPVGLWMPWEPEAYKTGRVEYLEDELNQLMHEKKKNDEKVKVEFEKRVREAKEKAIQENKEVAEKSGNVLTQDIDKEGNLFDINKDGNNNEISVADLHEELFNTENVVTDKNNDHGLSDLIESQKKHAKETEETEETEEAKHTEEAEEFGEIVD